MKRECGFASIEEENVCPGPGPASICGAQNQYTTQQRRGCGQIAHSEHRAQAVLKNTCTSTATPVSTPKQQPLLINQTIKSSKSYNLSVKTQKKEHREHTNRDFEIQNKFKNYTEWKCVCDASSSNNRSHIKISDLLHMTTLIHNFIKQYHHIQRNIKQTITSYRPLGVLLRYRSMQNFNFPIPKRNQFQIFIMKFVFHDKY
jgi:hypothetical protein